MIGQGTGSRIPPFCGGAEGAKFCVEGGVAFAASPGIPELGEPDFWGRPVRHRAVRSVFGRAAPSEGQEARSFRGALGPLGSTRNTLILNMSKPRHTPAPQGTGTDGLFRKGRTMASRGLSD